MNWAEAWDRLNDPAIGNVTCDGMTGCEGSMLGLLGIIVPVVLVIGLVGLIIAAIRFKQEQGKP